MRWNSTGPRRSTWVRIHSTAVRRQSDWSNRKYSSTAPEWAGREQIAHEEKTQVPRYLPSYSSSSSSSSSQEPQHPSIRQPLHLLPGCSGPCSCHCSCSSQVPARRVPTLGRTEACAFCLSPPPLTSSQPLPLPPVLGEAGLDPTTKERTSKGPHQMSHMCIAPSQRPETQTFLPCALIASHHTARATPTPHDNLYTLH